MEHFLIFLYLNITFILFQFCGNLLLGFRIQQLQGPFQIRLSERNVPGIGITLIFKYFNYHISTSLHIDLNKSSIYIRKLYASSGITSGRILYDAFETNFSLFNGMSQGKFYRIVKPIRSFTPQSIGDSILKDSTIQFGFRTIRRRSIKSTQNIRCSTCTNIAYEN